MMRYLTVILAMAVYSLEGLAQTPPPATVTMVMGYREFPTNTLIDSDQSTYHVPVGASENPTAPPRFQAPTRTLNTTSFSGTRPVASLSPLA